MLQSTPTINARIPLLISIAVLLGSITLSRWMTGMANVLIAIFWLLDGMPIPQCPSHRTSFFQKARWYVAAWLSLIANSFAQKIQMYIGNRTALIFSSIFLMHLIGLVYTTDFEHAIRDLRIKIPLLLMPLFFSTIKPLNRKEFWWVMAFFITALTVSTLISTWVLVTENPVDRRQISIFISHIRFSLIIGLAVFIGIYLSLSEHRFSPAVRILLVTVVVWLLIFLFMLRSINGIAIFVAASMFIAVILILRASKPYLKVILTVLILGTGIGSIGFVVNAWRNYSIADPINFSTLDTHTALGNLYLHDTVNFGIENGRFVGLYLSWNELPEAWNKRSEIDFNAHDAKNHEIRWTIIRYMSSKGYRKDAAGVAKLSEEDIRNIEQGVANVVYLEPFGVRGRLYETFLGIQNMIIRGDPNASSLAQRLEYWETAGWLIARNPIFGVGTGDIKNAFANAYVETNSPLEPRFRKRSHNQYLSIAVTFGLAGLAWFVVALLYPVFKLRRTGDLLFAAFLLIGLLSMLGEDTLETQAGVTFFAAFYSLLLWGREP
ncbi:MAG TPA: O-antigen ligase family protein [Bacteroidales bacterium]|nr:O-antigen ligase family protein [Bacteroidales bacterium]